MTDGKANDRVMHVCKEGMDRRHGPYTTSDTCKGMLDSQNQRREDAALRAQPTTTDGPHPTTIHTYHEPPTCTCTCTYMTELRIAKA